MVSLYQRIRDLRKDSERNQTKLAKLLGMSQTGYSKYETGENDVPVVILKKRLTSMGPVPIICWEEQM